MTYGPELEWLGYFIVNLIVASHQDSKLSEWLTGGRTESHLLTQEGNGLKCLLSLIPWPWYDELVAP